ncbi:hypothetical protein RISK_002788 [Rhodopirellula islandica]|uniref:Uncharacterized protein n=1 Tax=Rhodopirellula islandica TaxID=595434 RepID=A0A0J1BEU6_RHOIS|nr:hypothetical protein RISK_002788 [Rhodopirellula islandica]
MEYLDGWIKSSVEKFVWIGRSTTNDGTPSPHACRGESYRDFMKRKGAASEL